jgi:hypothetical protein
MLPLHENNSFPIVFPTLADAFVARMSFQDSQNDTFLLQAGVYLLVPRDLLLEILCFSYGACFLFFFWLFLSPWKLDINSFMFIPCMFAYRNEKNQLLLGIRRANRPQTVMPSSVLSSDSMHIGLLAAAAHAAATNSCFTVFYNPRL